MRTEKTIAKTIEGLQRQTFDLIHKIIRFSLSFWTLMNSANKFVVVSHGKPCHVKGN